MKRLITIMLLLSPLALAQCGKERWPVKTVTDSDIRFINTTPKLVTVEQLLALAAPTRKDITSKNDSRFLVEKQVYTLTAYVTGFKKEDDGDFHIVISSVNDPKVTMVVEMVSPDCVSDVTRKAEFRKLRDDFEAQFGYAKANFKVLAKPHRVTVTGIGFFDFIHGQRGVAPNGIEIHPVQSVVY